MEVILGALMIILSFYLLAFVAVLILGLIGVVFSFIANYIVLIIFIVALVIFFIKYGKKIYIYVKKLNNRLKPKIDKGVRVMMFLDIVLYGGIGLVVEVLFLKIVCFLFVAGGIYYMIYPNKYFEVINGK